MQAGKVVTLLLVTLVVATLVNGRSKFAREWRSIPRAARNAARAYGSIAGVLALSASLNFWNIDFPLGYHPDEPVKVESVIEGTQDAHHPLLMLQAARVGVWLSGAHDPQQVVEVGRSIQALFATSTVLVVWLLVRSWSGQLAALSAAALAVSPMFVVQGHYFMENALVTAFLVISLLAFLGYVRRPGNLTAAWVGLAAGCAISADYVAVMIVPLFLAAPMFGALQEQNPSESESACVLRFYRPLVVAGLVAMMIFLLANWPLLLDVQNTLTGIRSAATHAVQGDEAIIKPLDFWLAFQLRFNLAPGMGRSSLVVGVAGLLLVLVRWRRVRFEERLLALYAFVFYLVPEISPLKGDGYVLPVLPALILLGCSSISKVGFAFPSLDRLLQMTALVALVGAPLYRTVQLTSSIGDDTRDRAAAWLALHEGKALFEPYGSQTADIESAAKVDLVRARTDGVSYIVASSLQYDRYFFATLLPSQQEAAFISIRQSYVELFRYPYVEFLPRYEGYAFHNPTIRIVDIRQRPR